PDAAVFRLDARVGSRRFVKPDRAGPRVEWPDEAVRLRGLAPTGVPGARVLDGASAAGRGWLLLRAVRGDNLAVASLAPETKVTIVADALRALHRLAPATCPFDHGAARRIARARALTDPGPVDDDNLDDANTGVPLGQMVARLLAPRHVLGDGGGPHRDTWRLTCI
ncbi:phosphotransferase, partial [Burkholderia cenocepacia]|uniref:phosphotransferase n=1 Tax=Burkholderia cenocepacia TaxID=95486 RepID=UPI00406D2F36